MKTIEKILDGKYELAEAEIEEKKFFVGIKWRRVFDEDGEAFRPVKTFYTDEELREWAKLLKKHGFC